MRTAFGAFGEDTQPPPFPQPPLPGLDARTSDIPTTEDAGMVYVGGGQAPPVGGPSGGLPLDPLKAPNAQPAASGGRSWLVPVVIGAAVGIGYFAMRGGR
jgi:hypothetical protein